MATYCQYCGERVGTMCLSWCARFRDLSERVQKLEAVVPRCEFGCGEIAIRWGALCPIHQASLDKFIADHGVDVTDVGGFGIQKLEHEWARIERGASPVGGASGNPHCIGCQRVWEHHEQGVSGDFCVGHCYGLSGDKALRPPGGAKRRASGSTRRL